MSIKKVLIRLEVNRDVGYGHFYRSIALVDGVEGFDITIAMSPNSILPDTRSARPIKLLNLSSMDQEAEAQYLAGLGLEFDFVIVDHYQLDYRWEKRIKPICKSLIVIDDLIDRKHICSVLVNTALGITPSDYRELVGKDTKLLLGPTYIPLREEFLLARERSVNRIKPDGKVRKVLISFGATDHLGLTGKVIEGLFKANFSGEIHIITASSNPVIDQYRKNTRVSFHIDISNVGEIMGGMDLCFGAMGVSSFERASLGLPSVCVVTADNQRRNADSLSEKKAIILIEQEEIEQVCHSLSDLKFISTLQRVGKNSIKLCDGLGLFKLRYHLFGLLPNIVESNMNQQDEDFLYELQCQPGSRTHSLNPTIPTRDEHHRWYAASLDSPTRRMFSLKLYDLSVGYIRLDDIGGFEEISIIVSQAYRQIGVGEAALELAKKLSKKSIKAIVKSENQASVNLFKKAGFMYQANMDCYIWSDYETSEN